jgi:VanZ family protein
VADATGPEGGSAGPQDTAPESLRGHVPAGTGDNRPTVPEGPAQGGRLLGFLAAWVPVVLFQGLVFYLSSRPNLQVPQIVPHADKVAHFIEYATAGGLLFRALRLSGAPVRLALMGALLLASGLGVLDELSQRDVPGRCCSIYDWMADTLGAIVGTLLSRVVERRIPRRVWSIMTDRAGDVSRRISG